jgi:hypothetical protein
MAEAHETVETLKTSSDGFVKIAIEKYNEMTETIASQKSSIGNLREQLTRARSEPPVINRTVIHKTAEMVAQDHRVWGGSLMVLGASMLVVGVVRFRLGRTES